MKSDPHLFQAECPILEGQTYEVLCGKQVPRAKFVLMFDAMEMAIPLRLLTFRCCRKCMESLQGAPANPLKRERYIYGIVTAEQDRGEAA
jgi:hypothetical protein